MSDEFKKVSRVERSPKGLTDALFDAMDRLNNGLATHEEARAVAHTARAIIGIARLEMDAAKMSKEFGGAIGIKSLPGLGDRTQQLPQP